MDKDRYWEIWNEEIVDRLEKEIWGEAGNHPRGRHHELVQRHVALIPRGALTLLEVGCGPGFLYSEIKDGLIKYLGLDTSAAMIEKFRKRFPEANVRYGDVFNLSSEPTADCVVCEDVFMHLPGDLAIPLNQLWGRVNNGGALIVSMRMTEKDNPSWLIEREYVPMPNEPGKLDPSKKLIIRAENHVEFEAKIKTLNPEFWKEHFYDERTSIYEIRR